MRIRHFTLAVLALTLTACTQDELADDNPSVPPDCP